MNFSVDSNILVNLSNTSSPFYLKTETAISMLLANRDRLFIFPQNLVEFWAVSTRPILSNGLGFSIIQAENEIIRIRRLFHLSDETSAIYPEWQRLVSAHKVSGKNVHDTRIVAQMNVHGIVNLLTFNTKDFSRYTNINSVEPTSV